jgi:chemotaxis protein MotB
VIEQTEDGEDPVAADFHRARVGEGVGQGPMSDDQDADDQTDEKTVGEQGTRRPPGPGGPADTPSQGHSTLSREAAADAAMEKAQQEHLRAEQVRNEKAAFESAADQIKQAVQSDPALAALSKQLAVDMTPDGLRIQILDEVKLPMFQSGSSTPNERARLLMQKVVPVLMKLRHPISIAGHTDAAPFPGTERTNWELSTERANATRRLLTDGGFPESRVQSVTGHADRDPLLPADPMAAANRRIAIMVLREAPVPDAGRSTPSSH